jgi:hypothetical protein
METLRSAKMYESTEKKKLSKNLKILVPTLFHTRSMWSNLVAVCGIIYLCGFVGLVMYSKYFYCDPLTAQVSL